jgi:hypothetical protein
MLVVVLPPPRNHLQCGALICGNGAFLTGRTNGIFSNILSCPALTNVTGLLRGSLEDPSSNLGRRYVIVRSEVLLSTGKKVELFRQMRELWVKGVQLEELTREGHMPQTSLSVRTRYSYIVMSTGGFSPYRGAATPLPRLIYRPFLNEVSVELWTSQLREWKQCERPKTKRSLLQNLIEATFRLSAYTY